MEEIMGVLFLFIGTIVPIVAVGVVIYIIVQASKHKDDKNYKFKLSTKTLLQIYLYTISFLTLGIGVFGASIAIRAGLSDQFGLSFGYTLSKANDFEDAKKYDQALTKEGFEECYEGEVILLNDEKYCGNPQAIRTDLINGITIFVSMAILFGIHQFGISRIKTGEKIVWLHKFYTFASLILYSIVGLVAIPTAIYQLTNFLITEVENYTYSTPAAPAMAIAIALTTLPLWIYFLERTFHLKEEE